MAIEIMTVIEGLAALAAVILAYFTGVKKGTETTPKTVAGTAALVNTTAAWGNFIVATGSGGFNRGRGGIVAGLWRV